MRIRQIFRVSACFLPHRRRINQVQDRIFHGRNRERNPFFSADLIGRITMIVTSVYHWTSTVGSTTVTPLSPNGAILTSERLDRTATVITGTASATFDPMRKKQESSGVYENPQTVSQQRAYSSLSECSGPQFPDGVIWRQESMARRGLNVYGRTSTSGNGLPISNAASSTKSTPSNNGSTVCLPCTTW